jgi:hypothetical protein
VSRVIAHTHSSGRLALIGADKKAVKALGGKSTVVIDPRADTAARIAVEAKY